jgi:hypothetical protein
MDAIGDPNVSRGTVFAALNENLVPPPPPDDPDKRKNDDGIVITDTACKP